MKILIADDHPLVRVALQQLLVAEFPEVEVVEVSNGQEALVQVWKQDWAVLVLDISMPGRSGLDILGDVKKARPTLPVLIVTSHPEDQYALRVLKAGASGYLNKGAAAKELVVAVRQVLKGQKYITPSIAEKLVSNLHTDTNRPAHELLSSREFHVFRALAEGQTVKHIAHDLSVSIKTVSTYRTRVMEKLGLKTNADLTRYALQQHLIE